MKIMQRLYTDERNTQILIYLMKQHNVKKVIVSPGATNISLVASMQNDPYFELYSCVDERSAAYMACGLAAESGEPVALSCTGATASRNYVPGLTEAFYRKLPILVITSSQHEGRIGQHFPQMLDRTVQFNDIVKKSVHARIVHSKEDEWACSVAINDALLELRHSDGGPVHINLETNFSDNYNCEQIESVPVIHRIEEGQKFPDLCGNRIAVFVGNHEKWSRQLTEAVDNFCESNNAFVICDHTSKYVGKYGVMLSLITNNGRAIEQDIVIHIGEISGAYIGIKCKEVWRVSLDGIVRDTFKKLRYVFEMREEKFFENYCGAKRGMLNYQEHKNLYKNIIAKVPELPFSNVWIAKNTIKLLPKGSVLHLGILNSLRSWNFFEKDDSILGYSNTGGFGIDGDISSLVGAALANSSKLYFIVVGDLAFFYDMNVLGNRHVGTNIRILLINNGKGTEFKMYNHRAAVAAEAGKDIDLYVAASGHFGQQSHSLVKHYAEDLGFKYMSASNKKEYFENLSKFVDPIIGDKPILFEIFTNSQDESDALRIMNNLDVSATQTTKNIVKGILGKSGTETVKKLLGR